VLLLSERPIRVGRRRTGERKPGQQPWSFIGRRGQREVAGSCGPRRRGRGRLQDRGGQGGPTWARPGPRWASHVLSCNGGWAHDGVLCSAGRGLARSCRVDALLRRCSPPPRACEVAREGEVRRGGVGGWVCWSGEHLLLRPACIWYGSGCRGGGPGVAAASWARPGMVFAGE
jgi:hypothetical protein